MSRRGARWLAWGLWALDVLVILAIRPLEPADEQLWGTIGGVVFILVFATTGALVASRIPANPVGWLLCAAALSFAVGAVCVGVSAQAVRSDWEHPLVNLAAWVGTFVWLLGLGSAATFLLLFFPDGRLPSRRWRPVAWLAGGSLLAGFLAFGLAPGVIEETAVTNPVGLEGWEPALEWISTLGLAGLFVSILASCASLVVRYRGAGPNQRQQLKWVAWSLPVVLLWLIASILIETTQTSDLAVDLANAFSSVGLAIVPVAIGVAMLRHRLYDIDVVINRTLVYGSLTAILAGGYLGSVLVLQLVLSPLTEQSDLAVAGSTLAVAAAFGPIRRRIQGLVDRRFYRRRYDAARTLESFTARLRQEVDLESVSGDLRSVVRETVQPSHVSLWLRSAP